MCRYWLTIKIYMHKYTAVETPLIVRKKSLQLWKRRNCTFHPKIIFISGQFVKSYSPVKIVYLLPATNILESAHIFKITFYKRIIITSNTINKHILLFSELYCVFFFFNAIVSKCFKNHKVDKIGIKTYIVGDKTIIIVIEIFI